MKNSHQILEMLITTASAINAEAKGAYTAIANKQYLQVLINSPVTPFRGIGIISVDAGFVRLSVLPFLSSEKAAISAVLCTLGYQPASGRFKMPEIGIASSSRK